MGMEPEFIVDVGWSLDPLPVRGGSNDAALGMPTGTPTERALRIEDGRGNCTACACRRY